MEKTLEEIKNILAISRKFNIWDNPKRPNEVQEGCCEYCGKKHGKTPFMVHVTILGTCVPNNITEEDLSRVNEESQGGWAIGSTCAKKLFGEKILEYCTKQK